MSLRLKLILVAVISIALTVALSGYLGNRYSQQAIEKLAEELTKSKAEQAFALAVYHNRNKATPSDDLKKEIAEIKIAKNGYIFVVDNSDGPHKGVLTIHPSNVGLDVSHVVHIRRILDEIGKNNFRNGYSNFIRYSQYTDAKDRRSEMKIGYFKYFAPWNWVIIAAGYESDIFASSFEVQKNMIQIVISVSLIAIIMVYIIIQYMFRPVRELTESTREVAKGNWEISLPYNSNDEIGVLSESFNEMVKSLRENAYMWQEFEIARKMQISMLPESCPDIVGFRIGATSIPATKVGGDFYDFLRFNSKQVGIIIGDVSGHGLSAAMVMSAAMSTVKVAAEENEQTHSALKFANKRLNKYLQKNMFVALFYGIIDYQNMKIHYTNAGQPLPIICRNGQAIYLPQVVDGDRFPLGMVSDCTYYQNSFGLQSGDTLFFYTDGILETTNISNEFYDFDRFTSSIELHSHLDPPNIITKVIYDLDTYRGTAELNDDVTLVVIKIE
jgi:serine phosphatase RsbU (regulator of sigma subunit)